MAERLMSDERHSELIKAAADTIGLMNIGVDGNAALAKVAEDTSMNDHEVEIVAQAVNNSKQLAHLQTASPDKREEPFPLVDPEKVKSFKGQPPTNADDDTGDRYGTPDTPSRSAEQDIDQPDAPEIQEDLRKAASATWIATDYRERKAAVDHAAVLREGWGLQQEKVATAQIRPATGDFAEFQKLSHYQIGIDEARRRALEAREEAESAITKLAYEMRLSNAPKWAAVEKAASALGVDSDVLDLLYSAARLEAFGEPRADLTKTAGARCYVSPREKEIVDLCVHVDSFIKLSAACSAAMSVYQQRYQSREAELCGIQKEAAGDDLYPSEFVEGGQIRIDPGEISGELNSAARDYFADPDVITAAGGAAVPGEVSKDYSSIQQVLGQPERQGIKNLEARARLENLMGDEYVGTHELPEVIDAYNAAMSVNPHFGDAELVSYVRQHLATKGAVPLDMQIRARPGEQRRPAQDEEEP